MPEQLPSKWLVSTEWLAERLGRPDVVVVDGSLYMPDQKRNASAEYAAGHIPGAVFFDIDKISDHSSDLPHMLPGPEQFGQAVGALGIGKGDTIVIYDAVGLFAAPRVWWTFRLFGAENVFILDGGLTKWKAEGRPVDAQVVKPEPRRFAAEMDTQQVAGLADVQMALANGKAQIVDARPAGRFRGEAPEPRPGMRSGHMPGAFNVPSTGLMENGRLLSKDELRKAFVAGGVDLDKPVITSCGSGVSAATLWLALDAIGKTPAGLYDGSWSEWVSRPDMPVATKE